MKRYACTLLLALLLLLGLTPTAMAKAQAPVQAAGDVAVNEENFPDPGFRSFVMTLPGAEDGVLTYKERIVIREMEIDHPGGEFHNLRGLHFFPGLEVLKCTFTYLYEIDVTGNPNLRELYCMGNSITQLDVSQNPRLEVLACGYNDLFELDISKNPRLTSLTCYGNHLAELSVTRNPELRTLDCSENDLISLDLTGCPKLEHLDCSKNQLSALPPGLDPTRTACDTSGNARKIYSHISLEKLPFLDPDQITDIVGGTFTGGTVVFDRSSYNIRYHQTHESGYDEEFILILSGPSESVEISPRNFPDNSFRAKLKALPEGEDGEFSLEELASITRLDFSGDLTNPGTIRDLTGLDYFPALVYLTCSYNELQSVDLRRNPELAYLDLQHNALRTLYVDKNPKLEYLDCSHNKLHELSLTQNPRLREFHGSYNFFGGDFNLFLKANQQLSILYLRHNDLTDLDLSYCTKLDTLGLSANQLTELDLSRFPHLSFLTCDRNALTELDTSQNPELRDLSCEKNQITELDFSSNPLLRSLTVHSNPLVGLDLTKNMELQTFNEYDPDAYCERDVPDGIVMNRLDGLNTDRVSRLRGTVFDGPYLRFSPGVTDIAYRYDCGNGFYIQCRLNLCEPQPVPIDEAHFPDPNFRAFLSQCFQGTDGVFTPEELDDMTSLDCSNQGIRSLEGLEHFSSLMTLKCSGNELTEIQDLDTLPSLRELDCSFNHLYRLSPYDNQFLTRLDCSNNGMKYLFVYSNAFLSQLDCGNNRLEGLDLDRCINLDTLICSYNRLAELDLSQSKRLTQLNAEGNTPLAFTGLQRGEHPQWRYFDSDRALDLQGGSLSGPEIRFDPGSPTIAYRYDCGNGFFMNVLLIEAMDEPVITPGGGTFNGEAEITITTPGTPGVPIFYTTDGSRPTWASERYNGPFTIREDASITAIALLRDFGNAGPSTTADITILPRPQPPTILPIPQHGEQFLGDLEITIVSDEPDVDIYYTVNIDRVTPENGTLYTGPFTIDRNADIRAIAVREGFPPSDTAHKHYSSAPRAMPPVLEPRSGRYVDGVEVSLRSLFAGSFRYYYTTDGSKPTTGDTPYTGPFPIRDSCTVRAIAVDVSDPSLQPSIPVEATYQIISQDDAPVISPGSTTFERRLSIQITASNPDAELWLTTDGSDPTDENNQERIHYWDGSAFTNITQSCEVRAASCLQGVYSPVASAQYTQLLSVSFKDPAGGSLRFWVDGVETTGAAMPLKLPQGTEITVRAQIPADGEFRRWSDWYMTSEITPEKRKQNPLTFRILNDIVDLTPLIARYADHLEATMAQPMAGQTVPANLWDYPVQTNSQTYSVYVKQITRVTDSGEVPVSPGETFLAGAHYRFLVRFEGDPNRILFPSDTSVLINRQSVPVIEPPVTSEYSTRLGVLVELVPIEWGSDTEVSPYRLTVTAPEGHASHTVFAAGYDESGQMVVSGCYELPDDGTGGPVTIDAPGFDTAASVKIFLVDPSGNPTTEDVTLP